MPQAHKALGSLHLSAKNISALRAIYKECLGKEISKEEALAQGIRLLRLMELVYKPMTHEERQYVLKRMQELVGTERRQ